MRHHPRHRAPHILVAAAAAPPQVGSAPSQREPAATTSQIVSPLRLRYRCHGCYLDVMRVWHRCLVCAHAQVIQRCDRSVQKQTYTRVLGLSRGRRRRCANRVLTCMMTRSVCAQSSSWMLPLPSDGWMAARRRQQQSQAALRRGYRACLLTAMKCVASQDGLHVPADATVTATVAIGLRTDGDWALLSNRSSHARRRATPTRPARFARQ